MTILLLISVIILTIAICALATVWFVRDSQTLARKRHPTYRVHYARDMRRLYVWRGTRTSRSLR